VTPGSAATRVARWYIFIPKYPFGFILEGLGMDHDGIFYGNLEDLTAIWYI
jgi:hypothetical protein